MAQRGEIVVFIIFKSKKKKKKFYGVSRGGIWGMKIIFLDNEGWR